jgi:6-phosphofructokinase 1
MSNVNTKRGTIGILTGGGDVPGLNPAIRAVTLRACNEGYRVIGIRRGWAGLIDMTGEREIDQETCYMDLTEDVVRRIGRSGGTFLHSSRIRPTHVPAERVPDHLKDKYNQPTNDLTPTVLENLAKLGIDYLIPIGGDDTLSYAVHLYRQGVKLVAIPKTMDNDVPGTDYCIGFSTCVSRTIEMTNSLRTTAGSHERFLVIEVFGRYAGFTSLIPAMTGAADRCVIPEFRFDPETLTEILSEERMLNPSRYSIVLVSEGATFHGQDMVYLDHEEDMYGHKKLGGIGDLLSEKLKQLSPKFNNGRRINTISQRLGYLVRCGEPDAVDSIVPMVFGNIALDLILADNTGMLVGLKNGIYNSVPVDVVTSWKKVVDVTKYYNTERLRPKYKQFVNMPLFLATSDF